MPTKKQIEAKIAEKMNQFNDLMNSGKYAEAKAVQDELNSLQAIYDGLKDDENPQDGSLNIPVAGQPAEPVDAVKEFANAARNGFPSNSMSGGSKADGGYTVPEDIQTQIEKYRDSKFSLRQLVKVKSVSKKSGKQTFKKRSQQTGFGSVEEGGSIPISDTPQYEQKSWEIEDLGGIFPVTNDLLEDSDANITNELVEWIGDEERVTDNKFVLVAIGEKAQTKFSNVDDMKKAINVTLGQAFAPTSVLVTNDDGVQWLDTQKDNQNRDLLKSDVTNPLNKTIALGVHSVPFHVVPKSDMPSVPVYEASTSATVKAGKTYYTRTGSGTAESPYVYTAVASPTGNPSTSEYYEITKYQIPMIIGDLMEYCEIKDRKRTTIESSKVAVAGNINAFQQNKTLWRAIERMTVMVRDDQAIVNGYVEVNA